MLFSTYNIFFNPKLRDDNAKGLDEMENVQFAIGTDIMQTSVRSFSIYASPGPSICMHVH